MIYIDTPRFCQDGKSLNGTLTPAELPRLVGEVGPDSSFALHWEATGYAPDRLHLKLATSVQMRCQRCLGSLQESIEANLQFRFVKDEATAQTEDELSDELDHLVHNRQFDLLSLIEDEALMALPFVSLHEECPEAGAIAHSPKEQRPNPFAVLKNMA
jgi:uncharacterized protein